MTEETKKFYSLKNKQSPPYQQTFLKEDCIIQSFLYKLSWLFSEIHSFSQEVTRKGKQNQTLHTNGYFFLPGIIIR